MPYIVHPAEWTPERVAESADAIDFVRSFTSISLNDYRGCDCSSCVDKFCTYLEEYTAAVVLAIKVRTFDTAAAAHTARNAATEKVTFVASKTEKRAWRYRESAKFDSGEYIRVPWYEHEPYGSDRYPHLSLKTPGLIAYTKNDEHGVLDRQTSVKPGRYLKEFFPGWSDETIRDYASKCQAINFELRIASTADDILRVYRGGPDSCMSHEDSYYESSEHPVIVYGDSDLAVAYYGDIDRASARAIVWPDKMRYGRIYGGEHTMKALLEREGYTEGSMRGAHVRAITCDNTNLYILPYVDGIQGAEAVRRNGRTWIRLGGGGLSTTNTNGLSGEPEPEEDENSWCCDRCDGTYGEDDPQHRHQPVNRTYAQYICDDCYRELYTTCDNCNEYTLRENLTEGRDSNEYCESCADTLTHECTRDGCAETWIHSSNLHTLCESCTDAGWQRCKDCDTHYQPTKRGYHDTGDDHWIPMDGIQPSDLAPPADPIYHPHCSTCGSDLEDTATLPLPLEPVTVEPTSELQAV